MSRVFYECEGYFFISEGREDHGAILKVMDLRDDMNIVAEML